MDTAGRTPSIVAASLAVAAAIVIASCGAPAPAVIPTQPPVEVGEVLGDESHRLVLSESAARRLGIETVPVRANAGDGAGLAVPYGAILYDAHGQVWVYAVTDHLTFVRHPVEVIEVVGDEALLASGPPTGTEIVTVGVAELYGAETGVGGGH